jgi:hypothetical protein
MKTSIKRNIVLVCTIMAAVIGTLRAQQEQDLLSLLGREETTEYAAASFKTNKVINLHSLESTSAGVMDVKISHRFGLVSGGAYELWGLDQSMIRLGADYGITDLLTVGFGRSSFQKTYDGFIKYKLLRQSTGLKKMPITVAALFTTACQTEHWKNDSIENYFSSRLYYTYQLIIGRKFSNAISFEVAPTLVHRNLVKTALEENDVFAIGFAGRIKLNKRFALNGEWIYVPPGQLDPAYHNSLSLGVDIETGGHVFQLHFTNSTSMIEKGFICETSGKWSDADVHFGFNISRVFTLVKPKE